MVMAVLDVAMMAKNKGMEGMGNGREWGRAH